MSLASDAQWAAVYVPRSAGEVGGQHMVKRVVGLALVAVFGACSQPGRECAGNQSLSGAKDAPSFDCTAALKGSFMCPRGQVGSGYTCDGQCWGLALDGPCAPPPLQEDGGQYPTTPCAPADAGVPALLCTPDIEGSVLCTTGDFQCLGGCWTSQPGRCHR